MSYNITSCQIVKSHNFSISVADYEALCKELEDAECNPESSILDPGWLRHGAIVKNGKVTVKCFWWGGGDWALAFLVEKVLPKFSGSADFVFTWEGGDSFTGLRWADGKPTKHTVEMKLGAEKK